MELFRCTGEHSWLECNWKKKDRQSDKIIRGNASSLLLVLKKKRHHCNFGFLSCLTILSVRIWALAQLKQSSEKRKWDVFLHFPVHGPSSSSTHCNVHKRPLHRFRHLSSNGCKQVVLTAGTSTITTPIPASHHWEKQNAMAIIYHSYT